MTKARAFAVVAAIAASYASLALGDGATGRMPGTVKVTRADGQADTANSVIVYVVGFTDRADKSETIQQRNKHFVPDLIAITAGQEVTFPNTDTILHNVFSRSSVRPFDLGQYKKGQSKTKSFPKVGVVDVYCNIHPRWPRRSWSAQPRPHRQSDGTFRSTASLRAPGPCSPTPASRSSPPRPRSPSPPAPTPPSTSR